MGTVGQEPTRPGAWSRKPEGWLRTVSNHPTRLDIKAHVAQRKARLIAQFHRGTIRAANRDNGGGVVVTIGVPLAA